MVRAPPGLTAMWRWVVVVALGVVLFELTYRLLPASRLVPWIGHDYNVYIDAARRWSAGGSFYEPYQLTGPYLVHDHEILYPPPFLLILVPFTVLPAALWWLVPLAVTAAIVWTSRPEPWAWVAIALLLAVPITWPAGVSPAIDIVANGNPTIWIMAIVALATRWRAFGPFVLLKPTVAPFALVGIRHRAWWLGLGLLGLLSAAFAAMWPDYLRVIANARTDGPSLLYSLSNLPLLLIPVVAMLRGTGERSALRSR